MLILSKNREFKSYSLIQIIFYIKTHITFEPNDQFHEFTDLLDSAPVEKMIATRFQIRYKFGVFRLLFW